MTLSVWASYLVTVLILMSTPGPSHLLMLANSIGGGFPRSIATAAGDLSANLIQMVVAAAGLAALVRAEPQLFVVIKWLGVAYLVYLGIRIIRSRPETGPLTVTRPALRGLYWQGFMTSAANPKAIIFFAALFPQFIDPAGPQLPQFLILSLSYLLIDGAFLLIYGAMAGKFSRSAGSSGQGLRRVAGLLLIGAAILLGMRDVGTQ